MNGPRLVLVTRRFWPQVGVAGTLVANLAEELRRLGARPVILTAQVEKTWPSEVLHRQTPVVRLPHPPARFWRSLRYLSALSRWLRTHRDEIDAVCVSSLAYDAYTTLGALAGSHVPVLLRAERSGPDGDCQWQRRANFGARVRRRCLTADAIVASSESVANELKGAGYPRDRVHLIDNGVPSISPRTPAGQTAARASLAEAHPILGLSEGAPLVVCVGRLAEGQGLFDLVDAWPAIMKRWPRAKLWLVGQGPAAEAVWKRIQRHDLKNDVVLTGLFDDLEDVFLAADLFVQPATVEGASLTLLEAMAHALPIVATDLPATCAILTSHEHALLVGPNNSAALSAAMLQLLDDRRLANVLTVAARQRAEQRFSLPRMAREHFELFRGLIASKRENTLSPLGRGQR